MKNIVIGIVLVLLNPSCNKIRTSTNKLNVNNEIKPEIVDQDIYTSSSVHENFHENVQYVVFGIVMTENQIAEKYNGLVCFGLCAIHHSNFKTKIKVGFEPIGDFGTDDYLVVRGNIKIIDEDNVNLGEFNPGFSYAKQDKISWRDEPIVNITNDITSIEFGESESVVEKLGLKFKYKLMAYTASDLDVFKRELKVTDLQPLWDWDRQVTEVEINDISSEE